MLGSAQLSCRGFMYEPSRSLELKVTELKEEKTLQSTALPVTGVKRVKGTAPNGVNERSGKARVETMH